MSEPPEPSEAHRWLGQAHEDLSAAEQLAASGSPARVACFLAHLAVEKALKAALIAEGTPFRKVHDLFVLRGLLDPSTAALLEDSTLEALNPWVIEGRYPGDLDEASPQLADELVGLAQQTITTFTTIITRPS